MPKSTRREAVRTGLALAAAGAAWCCADHATALDVDLLDASMSTVKFAESGEPLAIRVGLDAKEPVAGSELILSIYDQSGTLVSEVSTRFFEAVTRIR